MTITIDIDNVIEDVQLKSHLECAAIPEEALRYKYEAGTEKINEIKQSLQDAHNALIHICRRFITSTSEVEAESDDNLDIVTEYQYELSLSVRRAQTIAEPLAKAMHAYLVDSTLSKFYNAVAKPDFAAIHETRCAKKQAEIEDLLYTKMQPVYD